MDLCLCSNVILCELKLIKFDDVLEQYGIRFKICIPGLLQVSYK